MTSSDSWTCDGVPKNGQSYPEFEPHEQHQPELNHSSDCTVCGLPKEAMDKPKTELPLKPVLIAVAIGGIFLGGGIAYTSIAKGCDAGMQKIDGQCIDPYLQPFQSAKQQGDEAIKLAQNYQTIEDLEKAGLSLGDAIDRLNQIPEEAAIFNETQNLLQTYKSEPAKIDANLAEETKAQQELTAAREIANQAAEQTNIAESTTQLNNAKQKWQEAQDKLKAIASDTLLAIQIAQLQSEYSQKISEIDGRIATIARQNRPRPTPKATTPRRVSKPRPKPVAQPKYKPKYKPKPAAKPGDPCAVPNPPANCLF